MTTRRTVSLALCWMVLGGLVLGACAAIPSSGNVNRVVVDEDSAGSTANFRPAPPTPGAAPDIIVRGFLDAMLAYPSTSRVAAKFLTPTAASSWNPMASTTVYTAPSLRSAPSDGNSAVVNLRYSQRAVLDEQGHFSARSGAADHTWELERVGSQWRIANPPDGLLVTQDWFDDFVRPFTLAFVDRVRGVVVPDPVHRVVGDQLATQLVSALALGPDRAVAAQVETSVPGVDVLRSTVPVGAGGVAEVTFTGELDEDADERDLSAQIVWTLRQVLGVKAVRLRVGGDVITFGDGTTQAVGSWTGYDPARTHRRVGVVQRGRSGTLDGKTVTSVGRSEEATATAVGTRIAMLVDDRIVVERRNGTALFDIAGTGLLAPVVDADDAVWAIEAGGRVRVRDLDERTVGRLPGVESFAVSPDASRYAAVVDGELVVGAIERELGRISGLGRPVRVTTGAGRARHVAWHDSTRLVHLSGSDPAAHLTRIDSSSTVPLGQGPAREGVATSRLVDIAVGGADTPRVYVLDDSQRVWLLDGEGWAPTAGLDVTSIS